MELPSKTPIRYFSPLAGRGSSLGWLQKTQGFLGGLLLVFFIGSEREQLQGAMGFAL